MSVEPMTAEKFEELYYNDGFKIDWHEEVLAALCERELYRSVLLFLLGPITKDRYLLPEGMSCANCHSEVGKDHYCRDCGWGCNPATDDGWKF